MYYRCSVSTCNQKRTGLAFCSVQCWDAHLPFANHKSAGAIEERAPAQPDGTTVGPLATPTSSAPAAAPNPPPQRKIVRIGAPGGSHAHAISSARPQEILVVQSKIRDYIAEKSGFNTSTSAYDWLSMAVTILCDQAIEEARADGRKTVMDRDFKLS